MTETMTSFNNEMMKRDKISDTASETDDGVQGAQNVPTDDDHISLDKSVEKHGEILESDLIERPGSATSFYDCLGNMCDCCLLAVICCFDGPNNDRSAMAGTNENSKRRKGVAGYYAMTDYEGVASDDTHDTFGWGQSESDHVETNDPGSWCAGNGDTIGGGGDGGDCGCGDGGGGGDCGGGGE